MADCLKIPTVQPDPVVDDFLFDVVQARTSAAIAIPLSKVMLQGKCLDHMYRTQEQVAEFLFKHPRPNSVIMSFSSKSRRHHSTLPDMEGNKLDAYGRHLYSTGALGIK